MILLQFLPFHDNYFHTKHEIDAACCHNKYDSGLIACQYTNWLECKLKLAVMNAQALDMKRESDDKPSQMPHTQVLQALYCLGTSYFQCSSRYNVLQVK